MMMTSYLATFSPCDKTKPAQPLPMTATVGFDMISDLLKPSFGAGASSDYILDLVTDVTTLSGVGCACLCRDTSDQPPTRSKLIWCTALSLGSSL
jgi:hypothetical protein